MRLKSLYLKILLSFFTVLCVTLVLILFLFLITAGRSFRYNIDKQSIAKLKIFRQGIQKLMDDAPTIPFQNNERVKEQLSTYSNLFDLNIWATSGPGENIWGSSTLRINLNNKKFFKRHLQEDEIELYHLSRRHFSYYAQVPVKQNNQTIILHLHLEKKHHKKPEAVFLIGILIIGSVVATLIIPLTRRITKRIKRLNQSALNFANGNLSCRTDIPGRDEIAELGKSFNFMADKLEKMIQGNQELTANLSHELRSPLARIRVSKELIQAYLDKQNGPLKTTAAEKNDISAIKRYIDSIEADIETLDKLIDDILSLSKTGIRNSSPEILKIKFGMIISEIEQAYKNSLDHKNLEFDKSIDDDLVLYSDPEIIQSVFSSLFNNAVKFTQKGGRIGINAIKEGTNITITMINTYRRLSNDELVKIFEPFYRLDHKGSSGSGLGLTIIKNQLKQCNASIEAKNGETDLKFEIRFS